jgi:hypothetical protein
VNHRATAGFWRSYYALPQDIRDRAEKAFALLKSDPRHPSLRLKKVGSLWSARISRDHRAWLSRNPTDWCGYGSARTLIMRG